MSLEILLVANLVSQLMLQNSASLGKNALSNTEGTHSSKKFVNSTGEIGTFAVKKPFSLSFGLLHQFQQLHYQDPYYLGARRCSLPSSSHSVVSQRAIFDLNHLDLQLHRFPFTILNNLAPDDEYLDLLLDYVDRGYCQD